MIKFFRKIRQKLLSEGSFKKYLIYAFGEIILVVIGILIALQINNWNERDKNRDKEIVYLNRLVTNLNYDINLYELIMKKDSMLVKELKSYLNDDGSLEKNMDNPIQDMSALITGYKFTANRTTIDNLISSGQVEIIRSNYLIEDIFLYYRTTEDMDKGIDEAISQYNRATFGPLLIKLNKDSNRDNSKMLKSSIQLKLDLLYNQLDIYDNQKKLAKSLIDKINKELEILI